MFFMVERFGDLIRTSKHEEKTLMEKHTLYIEAPDSVKAGEELKVTIIVGKEVAHPNTWEHYIKWVQIFVEGEGRAFNLVHVATYDLGPTYGEPKVALSVKLRRNSKLWVLAYCNLHGLWENYKEVRVES